MQRRALIPADVQQFIAESIDSVELLEILILLRKTAPQAWAPEKVSQELRTHVQSSARKILDLENMGLVRRIVESNEVKWAYDPASEEKRDVVERLIKCYSERRVTVIELIFTKPKQNIQVFADAFKIRKDS